MVTYGASANLVASSAMAFPRALLETIAADAPQARSQMAELLGDAGLPFGEETVEL